MARKNIFAFNEKKRRHGRVGRKRFLAQEGAMRTIEKVEQAIKAKKGRA